MHRSESWTIKKAECWRIDAFELWCWRRLLRVSWTARRSSQSILKEINPEYSLEGLMVKLKLQYFGHLMWRADSLGKTLMVMLGKTEGKWRRGNSTCEMVRWHRQLNRHNLSKLWEIVKDRDAWHAAVYGSQSWRRLSDWITSSKFLLLSRNKGGKIFLFKENLTILGYNLLPLTHTHTHTHKRARPSWQY